MVWWEPPPGTGSSAARPIPESRFSTVVTRLARDPNQPGSLPSVTTYPVKGQILLRDGKPLTEGTVTWCVPLVEGLGRFPSGPIEADGTFSVSTKDCGGAAAGGNTPSRSPRDLAAVTRKDADEAGWHSPRPEVSRRDHIGPEGQRQARAERVGPVSSEVTSASSARRLLGLLPPTLPPPFRPTRKDPRR